MPDDPTTAKMLSEEERKLAMARIDADAVVKSHGQKERTSWKLVGHSFNVVVSGLLLRLKEGVLTRILKDHRMHHLLHNFQHVVPRNEPLPPNGYQHTGKLQYASFLPSDLSNIMTGVLPFPQVLSKSNSGLSLPSSPAQSGSALTRTSPTKSECAPSP